MDADLPKCLGHPRFPGATCDSFPGILLHVEDVSDDIYIACCIDHEEPIAEYVRRVRPRARIWIGSTKKLREMDPAFFTELDRVQV